MLLHRLGDSFAHREIGNESKVYDTGLGHARHGTDPDKVLRRPGLYDDYVRLLVDVLAERQNLSVKERNEIKSRISIFNPAGANGIGAVLGRRRNPEEEHEPAKEIVRDYLIRGQQVVRHRLFDPDGQDSTELKKSLDRCLSSNPCIERAFEFRIKDRIRWQFAITYEPEKEDFGVEHGIFFDKDVEDALGDIKYRGRFQNRTFTERNVRRAIQRTEELLNEASFQESEIRERKETEQEEITGIVGERLQ